jgi:hypothetical protein
LIPFPFVSYAPDMLGRLVVLALAAAGLHAQWFNYPTGGVPRLPNGKANLSAPAPRTADGKPDFSGMWTLEHRPILNQVLIGERPCNPGNCAGQEFYNIGRSLKGGLPYQPWAAEAVRVARENNRLEDPLSHCLPIGVVRSHTYYVANRKFIQVPGLLVMLSELNASYRQIFTDGRPLPEGPNPTWNGYSSGKWEGDTLVIQTIGFREGLWLDSEASPLTEAAKMTERIRRPDFGTLEVDLTVDDPKAYTKPWRVKLVQKIVLDDELLDYICLENEKDLKHLVGKYPPSRMPFKGAKRIVGNPGKRLKAS